MQKNKKNVVPINKIADRRLKQEENEILNILYHTLKYEIYDKDIKMCTFTYVSLSMDKSNANVYVDYFDRKKVDDLVKKLNYSKAVFRTELSKNMNV
jgi:ribosome-binding factor A